MANGNDGSGCALSILTVVVLAGVIVVAVAVAGLPTISAAGLAWDTTASADRQATERLRIETDAQTERLRIAERANTERTALLIVGIVAVLAVAGGLAVAVAREAARRPVIVVQPELEPRRLHGHAAHRLQAGDLHIVDAEPRRLSNER